MYLATIRITNLLVRTAILLCSCIIGSAYAETVVCPYDHVVVDGTFDRSLSLNRNDILAPLVAQVGRTQPWSYTHDGVTYPELEVAGNRAVVTLDFAVLTPALRSVLVSPAGANCQVVLAPALPSVLRPARVPRANPDGTPNFDDNDTSRIFVKPNAWGRRSNLRPFVQRFFSWLSPSLAYALGAFPDVQLLTNCDNTNNTAEYETAETGTWSSITNTCGCVTAGCNAYWTARNPPADADATVLISTAASSGSPNTWVGLRGTEAGAGVNDGYLCRTIGMSTHQVTMQRMDNNGRTTIGAPVAQTISSGDSLGMRIVGSTVDCYYKVGAGAWTSLVQTTNNTEYPNVGFAFAKTDGTVIRLDDWSITATSARQSRQVLVFP